MRHNANYVRYAKFGNVERNSHCDVLHFTRVRVARLFLDCNVVFAIKAYSSGSGAVKKTVGGVRPLF